MDFEVRKALADELCSRVIDVLGPELLTGTGEQFRERKLEMIRLAAKVSGAVLYDDLSPSEQLFRTRSLETKILQRCEQGGHVWSTPAANDDPPDA